MTGQAELERLQKQLGSQPDARTEDGRNGDHVLPTMMMVMMMMIMLFIITISIAIIIIIIIITVIESSCP